MSVKDLLTVSQFAKLGGISTQRVRKAISDKVIKANKLGCAWVIELDELNKYKFRGKARNSEQLFLCSGCMGKFTLLQWNKHKFESCD